MKISTDCVDNKEHAANCEGWVSSGYCDTGKESKYVAIFTTV